MALLSALLSIQAFQYPTRLHIDFIEKNCLTIPAVLFVQADCQPVIICEDVNWHRTAHRLELVSRPANADERGPVLDGRRTVVAEAKIGQDD